MVTKHIQTIQKDHKRPKFAVTKGADNRHYPQTTTTAVRESLGSGFDPRRPLIFGSPCPILKQPMPSPGGQVSGMVGTNAKPGRWGGGVWHPADLPEGYHTAPRGHAWPARVAESRDGAPGEPRGRADARSTGCHTVPSVHDHQWLPGIGSIRMGDRSRSGRLQAVTRRVAARIGEK
jgi:hypothetical protein